jgi:hypothetical protein
MWHCVIWPLSGVLDFTKLASEGSACNINRLQILQIRPARDRSGGQQRDGTCRTERALTARLPGGARDPRGTYSDPEALPRARTCYSKAELCTESSSSRSRSNVNALTVLVSH